MKRNIRNINIFLTSILIAGGIALATSTAHAGAPAIVTNGNDSGPGSLRAALSSGANKVIISGYVASMQRMAHCNIAARHR